MKFSQIFLQLVLISISISCAETTPYANEKIEISIDKIINGAKEAGESATVAIANQDGFFFCTGTLIAPNVVLTAGHCSASYDESSGQSYYTSPAQVFVVSNGNIIEVAKVTDYLMHPSWTGANLLDGVDLSLLYLDRNLRPTPIPLDNVRPSQRVNTVGKSVGYGLTNGRDQNSNSNSYKMSVRLKVAAVEADEHLLSLVSPDQSFRGTCNGDSGGPFFIQTALGAVLAGVTSYGDQYCEQDSYNVAVYPHIEWINQNLKSPIYGNKVLPKDSADQLPKPDPNQPNPNQPDPNQPNEGVSCSDLYDCVEACQDNACINRCSDQASEQTINTINELYTCFGSVNCATLECLDQKCNDQVMACFGHLLSDAPPADNNNQAPPADNNNQAPPADNNNQAPPADNNNQAPPMQGQEIFSCTLLYECVNVCSNQSCVSTCADQSNNQVIELLNALYRCIDQNGCTTSACVNQHCADEVAVCFQ
jgi:V8-like Glu-specific endopeptidase